MPNRILREGWKDSTAITSLSWREQVFFLRLLSTVDDFGRFDGRAPLLRAACFPLELDKVSESDTESCLHALEAAGVVRLYEVQGKRFVELLNFRQQVRAKASKYPEPPSACVADAQHIHSTCVADAQHMHSTCVADAQHMHTKTKSKTYIYKKRASNTTANMSAQPDDGATVQPARALSFEDWLAAVCSAHSGLSACRVLPRDCEDAARDAFEAFPHAAEHGELLAAYLRSGMPSDSKGTRFWRPHKFTEYFATLGEVVEHARRWQKETRWKPAAARKTKPEPKPEEPEPGNAISGDDVRRMFAEDEDAELAEKRRAMRKS